MIGQESDELFKENYKDPDEYCCLLWWIANLPDLFICPTQMIKSWNTLIPNVFYLQQIQ